MATASRVARWLLIEQGGPWGRDALVESQLDPLVARAVLAHCRRHGVRPVLIRRPGWRAGDGGRRVYLAHTGVQRRWIEQHELTDPTQLLGLDLAGLAVGRRSPGAAPGPDRLHLVCTNGRHDQCCADFGRPVVRALDAAGRPDVWECSHIGGDRFAANLVCFPAGVYFGRVPPERAAALVDGLAAGHLDLEHYRGRCCFPPLVQAAEIFARHELDERRLEGVQVTVTHATDDEATARVTQLGGAVLEVTVARARGPLERLTCTANGATRPWQYRLVRARPLPTAGAS